MKVNEFNLGNWFLADRKPKQFEWTDYSPSDFGYTIDNYVPILITKEILELNGFKFKENDNEWWHYDPFPFSDFQLGYDENNNLVVIFNFNHTNIIVNYVHQLQNIFKCCKLNNLANNFKINN